MLTVVTVLVVSLSARFTRFDPGSGYMEKSHVFLAIMLACGGLNRSLDPKSSLIEV